MGESEEMFDAVVVGAGSAGLSAALHLSRFRLRTRVYSWGEPRNYRSHGVHGLLGRHGCLATDLLGEGRREVEMHGGQVIDDEVTDLHRAADGTFTVCSRNEPPVRARRILLATGVHDTRPVGISGFEFFWGKSVHHCPVCDGWEVTGKEVVVLGSGRPVAGLTLNLATYTDRLTVLTHGDEPDFDDDVQAKLDARGIRVRTERITALVGPTPDKLERVVFESGDDLSAEALFFNFGHTLRGDLHLKLGCQIDEQGALRVDAQNETTVPGVFAAGDLTPNSHLVTVALAEGARAAICLRTSLLPDWQRV